MKKIDQQLDDQTEKWLKNDKKGFDGENKVSRIFLWFEKDFKPSVAKFIKKYTKKDLDDVQYFAYDWTLNGN